jgi:hypothetical protein
MLLMTQKRRKDISCDSKKLSHCPGFSPYFHFQKIASSLVNTGISQAGIFLHKTEISPYKNPY